MPLTRLPDWMQRLMAYVAARPQPPFIYGRHDCALFAAGAVQAMTGADFAAPYRGRYTTLTGGLRVLRRDGFADHVALAAAHLPEAHPSQLLPGDLAVLSAPDGQRALGVVQGAGVYLLDPLGRIVLRPLAEAVQGFRV